MKKGISLVVLVLTIVVMIILAGVVIINIGNTFVNADLSKFKSDVSQLQHLMSIYKMRKSGGLDFETVQFDTSSLNYGELEQFEGEDIIDNKIKLYIIDLNDIDSEGINFGNLQNGSTDRYLYSLTTGKVYYEQGFQYDNCKIYTETNNMPSYTVASSIQTGDYIEYKVTYTDMLQPANVYSSLNGWRIISCTENSDGTFSNVKIISTGVPANLDYHGSGNNSWWETGEDKLSEFRSILTNTGGDKTYTFYTGNKDYTALKVSAGLYYNFGNIKFMYSDSNRGNNLGFFTSIISNGITYNSSINNNVEKTGNDLFNILGTENAEVRLLTLPELNIALGRTDIDSKTQLTVGDTLGLYKLKNLTQVPNMDNFTVYPDSKVMWLASPDPDENEYGGVSDIYTHGLIHRRIKLAFWCKTSNCYKIRN